MAEPTEEAWELLGGDYVFGGEDVERSMRRRSSYEVVVQRMDSEHLVLGAMRHELEHVSQHREDLWLIRTATACAGGFEDRLGIESPAFRASYAALASERGADLASTRLTSEELGPPSPTLSKGPFATLLACSGPPSPREELRLRLFADLVLLPGAAAESARARFCPEVPKTEPMTALRALLEGLLPGVGSAVWNEARAAEQVTAVQQRFVAELDAASRLPLLLDEQIERLRMGVAAVEDAVLAADLPSQHSSTS